MLTVVLYTHIIRYMSWSFLCSVSSVKTRGGCSICWYWWN